MLDQIVRAREDLRRVRLQLGVQLRRERVIKAAQDEARRQRALEAEQRRGVQAGGVVVEHRPAEHLIAVDLQDQAPPGRVVAVDELLRQTLHVCVRLGRRPYLAGWHELDEALKQRIWGDDYTTFERLRRKYDPDSLFNATGWLDSSPET